MKTLVIMYLSDAGAQCFVFCTKKKLKYLLVTNSKNKTNNDFLVFYDDKRCHFSGTLLFCLLFSCHAVFRQF